MLKFDVQTAKKLLSDYADKVNLYMKENTNLKTELADVKTSLEINKEILFKNLNNNANEEIKNYLKTLKKDNERLTENISNLYKEKIELEKKIYKTQQQLDEYIAKNKEKLDNQSTEIFTLSNQLKEKESLILQLKKELNKYYREDYNSTKELIICEPDHVNIEMNNELCETRELITKYSHLLQENKKKFLLQEKQIERLKAKLKNSKKKKKIKETMENIQMFDYILTSSEGSGNSNNRKSETTISNLESPIIKFPEKIKQPKYLTTDENDYSQNIPKLDFTKVLSKYTPVKHIDVIEGVKLTNRSSDEYIEKLKFQLKFYRNAVKKYKKKNHQLKKLITMLKEQCIKLRNNNNQISSNSTVDKTPNNVKENNNNNVVNNNGNKNKTINDSMEANTSQIDIGSNIEESEFNYIIKEYNKNICETYEK